MLSPRQIACPSDAEIERSAFNAAFYELGLRWYWDDARYEQLASMSCERSRLEHYLTTHQAHLLRAYDADFLSQAILQAKRRHQQALAQCATGAMPCFDWSDARWGEVGI